MALNKMLKLRWRGIRYSKGGSPPKGMEPEDFALLAIQKLLSGDRTWNREVDPTVEEHLKGTIDSDINHLADSHGNRFGKRPPLTEEGQEPFMLQVEGRESSPDQVVIDRDW